VRAATIVDGNIEIRSHPDPRPEAGQLLVRVASAGLNGADMIQLSGGYPPPPGWPADIPGMELAGTVEAVGPGPMRFGVGDRVMAVVGGGAQASLAIVPDREAMPVPDKMDLVEAGGFPEVFTTAHDALFTQAGLRMGEHLLIHGAAGGVGVAAVQLGAAAGARVTATCRNPERRGDVAALGATVIDPSETLDHGPYDVILELVGAPNMEDNLRALATGGRIAVIGTGAGAQASINLGLLMRARGRIHGSTLRARPPEEKAMAARAIERSVLPLVTAGRVRVLIDSTFPLSGAADAYARFAAGGKLGKIVIVADD